ncbi:hypothetical protein [Flavihumibacter solisilvae]|nr:hypothetical protein [Flavihumibacter solisilvae]
MNTTATLKRVLVMVLTIGGLMMGADSFAHDGKKDRKDKRRHAVQRREKCGSHHIDRRYSHRYDRNDHRYYPGYPYRNNTRYPKKPSWN